MKETIANINKSISWFFEKKSKIDKTSARLIKKENERAQINKIRNEREVTTDTTEIQRKFLNYYNYIDNLGKMDKFLEIYNLLRLN